MAARPHIPPQGAAPQHFTPPTPRELRAQAVNRLQVGLFGLAAMLLLVGLANIIMERARMMEAASPATQGLPGATASPKSDPLADIGVIPSPDAAREAPQRAPAQ